MLGACGLAPAGRTVARPPRPRAATVVTIRSLTGVWEATAQSAGDTIRVVMVLQQTSDAVSGSLTVAGLDYPTDAEVWSRVDRHGHLTLVFGHSPNRFVVDGRMDASADRLQATITGGDLSATPTTFFRR